MRKLAWMTMVSLAVVLVGSIAVAQEERAYPFEGRVTLAADVDRLFGEDSGKQIQNVWGYSVTLGYFVSPNFDIAATFADWEGRGAMWSGKIRYWFITGAERPNPTFYVGAEVGRTTNLPSNATVWGVHAGVDWLITSKVSVYGELSWRHAGGDVDQDKWTIGVGVRTSF
ncbi:MAG: hypothetical protein GDYSWBUE_000871 [Candidatus Fervidibacterota bacterium]